MEEAFKVLVADPPWPFGDKLPGGGRGAVKHYRTMPLLQIATHPLPLLHDDALLFLWRVAAMQEEALQVMRAWGFVPKSEVVWVKTTEPAQRTLVHGTKEAFIVAPAFGMGRYVRHAHEVCLIGARGRAARHVRDHAVRSVVFAPRQEHSRKPDEFYALVERLYPGPYVELFARRRWPGWSQEGDQLPRRKRSEVFPRTGSREPSKTAHIVSGHVRARIARKLNASQAGISLAEFGEHGPTYPKHPARRGYDVAWSDDALGNHEGYCTSDFYGFDPFDSDPDPFAWGTGDI